MQGVSTQFVNRISVLSVLGISIKSGVSLIDCSKISEQIICGFIDLNVTIKVKILQHFIGK